MRNDEDLDPYMEECRHRNDWPKWKEAIQTQLNSLTKREVFKPVIQTPEDVKPVGYKWVFVRKLNENNEIIRYKVRLVAQGFSQKPGIDYEETFSPVMDAITYHFLISLVVPKGLYMRLMNVIITYLYGKNKLRKLKTFQKKKQGSQVCFLRLLVSTFVSSLSFF